MPIYEYECSGCENRFEIVCSVIDYTSSRECPRCSGNADRIFTVPPNITRLHDPSVLQASLEKRSLDHSIKHMGDNISRIQSGERQGSMYSPETQKKILIRRGKKVQE